MNTPDEDLAARRARESIPSVRRAAHQAREVWWKQQDNQLSCASCGAPIHHRPAEGQGLPCGH